MNNALLSKKYGSLTKINILINFLSMYKRLLIAILIIKEKEKIAGKNCYHHESLKKNKYKNIIENNKERLKKQS